MKTAESPRDAYQERTKHDPTLFEDCEISERFCNSFLVLQYHTAVAARRDKIAQRLLCFEHICSFLLGVEIRRAMTDATDGRTDNDISRMKGGRHCWGQERMRDELADSLGLAGIALYNLHV